MSSAMLNVVDYVSDDLAPTRTYQRRSFVFIPAYPEYTERTGFIGNLITKLQHSRRGVHRAVEVDSYGVERDSHSEPGDNGGAAFWLVNYSDKTQEEPYRCVVGGLTPRCTCKASKCQVRDDEGELVCKHYASLRALIAAGVIEGAV